MPNWKKVIISGSDASLPNIYLDDYIIHNGDSNTYFGFEFGDAVKLNIGDANVIRYLPTYTVFNDGGENVNFRVESEGDANALFVKADDDNVGIGTSTPGEKLDVIGNVQATGDLLINDQLQQVILL